MSDHSRETALYVQNNQIKADKFKTKFEASANIYAQVFSAAVTSEKTIIAKELANEAVRDFHKNYGAIYV